MDTVVVLIVWAIFAFVVPRIFGGKKQQKEPYKYPDQEDGKTQFPQNTDYSYEEDDEEPWYARDLRIELPPEPVKTEPVRTEPALETLPAFAASIPQRRPAKAAKVTAVAMVELKTKSNLNKAELRRGIVVAALLGKPRSQEPYRAPY